jgi:hypothetical protein
VSTVDQLRDAPVDTWCTDAAGDRWLKTSPERWTFNDETFLSPWALNHVWGPITIGGVL